jgi:hypothetical protein
MKGNLHYLPIQKVIFWCLINLFNLIIIKLDVCINDFCDTIVTQMINK